MKKRFNFLDAKGCPNKGKLVVFRTDCDRQAPAREHAQPPQLHLHVDDDRSWPHWGHNPEPKASFLEPDQNRKTVPSDVAGVL